MAVGTFHSTALTATGELWSWGRGNSGQLGHGDKESSSVPMVVNGTGVVTEMTGGYAHSLLITTTGGVSFGANTNVSDLVVGQLGHGAEVEEVLTPRAIVGIIIDGGEEGGNTGGEEKE